VDSALARAPGSDVKLTAAFVLAVTGDVARARALVGQLEKTGAANSVLNLNTLPTIRARIEISAGNPSQAIRELEAAVPFDLGNSPLGNLYPAYVRGQAYLAAHEGNAATREFQKLIDHPGIVMLAPTGALAHLGLARAYALQRESAKAKTAYQDFLALWKDADPGIPILKQAKAEYAKLQ